MPRSCVPQIVFDKPSADGTHKWLLGDGRRQNAIESVLHPGQGPRHAVRVLARSAARLNCTFCSHRHAGLQPQPVHRRDHRPGVGGRAHLGNVPHQQRKLTNVVMMGMGEPLLNFDNVVRAMSVMRDDLGYGLANKRVTLSTAGLVPMIDKLSERERRVAGGVAARAQRRAAQRSWCRSTRSTRSPS